MVHTLPSSRFPGIGPRNGGLHGIVHAARQTSSSCAPMRTLHQHHIDAAAAYSGGCTAAIEIIRSQPHVCSAWRTAAGQRSCTACRAAASNADAGAMSGFFNMLGQMMQQGQASEAPPSGAVLGVNGVSYHPPGTCRHVYVWMPALTALCSQAQTETCFCALQARPHRCSMTSACSCLPTAWV